MNLGEQIERLKELKDIHLKGPFGASWIEILTIIEEMEIPELVGTSEINEHDLINNSGASA